MKIFNIDKTMELKDTEIDFTKGYLKEDILITDIPEIKAVKEKGHFIVVAEYPNGGKETQWVVDIPGIEGKPAIHTEEKIQVYIPYTKKEMQIFSLKDKIDHYQSLLHETDHWALKYAEGYYTESEYTKKKQIRESYRQSIREIQEKIEQLEVN